MPAKAITSILNALKPFTRTKTGVYALLILCIFSLAGFIVYQWPNIQEVRQATKKAREAATDAQESDDVVDSLTVRVSNLENDVDYLHLLIVDERLEYKKDINEVSQRDYEKGQILLEELDPIDSLGAQLYMTNPGNLYYNKDGHFITVVKDHHKKQFYYLDGKRRIYLP